DIEGMFRRYIVFPKGAAETFALWTLHAWTMDAGDVSPFLVLVSPTKRCGKTSVLIVLYYITPRSELASNISPSALFRYVEEVQPPGIWGWGWGHGCFLIVGELRLLPGGFAKGCAPA